MTASSGPMIRIFDDLEAVSRTVAEVFASLAQGAMKTRGRFTVALSGGATPRRLYSLLASSPYRDHVGWKRTHVFWADERCVAPDHEDSNFRLVVDTALSRLSLPEENIHRVPAEEGPDRAAQLYEQDLRAFFGPAEVPVFDLIILGMGEDGHTASLFPGSIALHERNRLAVPVHFDPPKLSRVSLTFPVLNHALQALFIVTGRSKAGVVHEIMEDGNPRQYPAGLVKPAHGTVTWFLDREAAENLTSRIAV